MARPGIWRTAPPPLVGSEALYALYDAVYKGADETPPWRTVLALLRETLSAAHTVLILRPAPVDEYGYAPLTSPQSLRRSHFLLPDPFATLPIGAVVTVDGVLGARRLENPLNGGYLIPSGVRDVLAVDVRTEDGIEARFRATRQLGAAPFGPADKVLCQALVPHLLRSIRLWARLNSIEHETHLSVGEMKLMRIGVIDVSENGAILATNQEGTSLLTENDGVCCAGGYLRASLHDHQDALKRRIDLLRGGYPGPGPSLLTGLELERPRRRDSLSVLLRPGQNAHVTKAKIRVTRIYLRRPESEVLPPGQVMQQLFGLVKVEAAIASLLLDGSTLEEAADHLGIDRRTACAHLRKILWKAGMTRQTAFVQALQSSLGTFG